MITLENEEGCLPVGNAHVSSRSLVASASGARELADDSRNALQELLLIQGHVGTMPRWEKGRGMGAVADALAWVAIGAIPGDVGNAVNARDLVVGASVGLRHPLEVVQSQQEKIPLVGVGSESANLETWLSRARGAGDCYSLCIDSSPCEDGEGCRDLDDLGEDSHFERGDVEERI